MIKEDGPARSENFPTSIKERLSSAAPHTLGNCVVELETQGVDPVAHVVLQVVPLLALTAKNSLVATAQRVFPHCRPNAPLPHQQVAFFAGKAPSRIRIVAQARSRNLKADTFFRVEPVLAQTAEGLVGHKAKRNTVLFDKGVNFTFPCGGEIVAHTTLLTFVRPSASTETGIHALGTGRETLTELE